ncbi:MAG: hypothetical protein AW09_003578 [Candidatus Accumulibacter phosphatis]|uniref:Uncharacterized protein n=1 Tax=Candidatus Accumulibacter phosphatis TaxID=327160 RepID=A0A080LUF8_9PROT|nr:MAG: hypothetical protein AW09_003578 [Candidatus Accumulibacter phosphatis]
MTVFPVDPEQNGQRHAVGQNPRTTETHQRQRQTFGRQQAGIYAHVDERLHTKPDTDTLGDERRVQAIERDRLPANRKRTLDDQGEEENHGRHPDEAQFLSNDRQQEVRMRLGQVEQLLDACAEADAEQLAPPEGNQGMRKLVAATKGVRPGIHETKDAITPVR